MPKVGLTLIKGEGNGVEFDEWYAEWLPKATAMAKRLRIVDFENAAAEVLCTFWRCGYLAKWDPNGGRTLKSFCFKMIEKRLFDQIESEKRHTTREALTNRLGVTSDDGDDIDFDAPAEMGSAAGESIEKFETKEVFATVSMLLHATVDSESSCHPADLFDALADAALTGEKYEVKELAGTFGINSSTFGHQRRTLAALCDDVPEFHDLLLAAS